MGEDLAVCRGTGLLNRAGFSTGANQCGSGQDGWRVGVDVAIGLLPGKRRAIPSPRPSRQPSGLGQQSRASCLPAHSLAGWLAGWLSPSLRVRRRGRSWRPVHHRARWPTLTLHVTELVPLIGRRSHSEEGRGNHFFPPGPILALRSPVVSTTNMQ